MHPRRDHYDVIVAGGAYSGAVTGLLLKQRRPATRILIVERSQAFDRKVGESTAEISACMMSRVLGLAAYMGHEQLPKFGLRMWFANDPTGDTEGSFEKCAEIGPRYQPRLQGFQVDRSTLDTHLLNLAADAGCEVLRPAKIRDVVLPDESSTNTIRVTIDTGGPSRTETTGSWFVDASGRAALLGRKFGIVKPLKEHPTNALWARFQNVEDWDGAALRAAHPAYARASRVARAWSTNHLSGYGWWVWIIPLKGGHYSVGLVYDTRLFSPPTEGTIADRVLSHVRKHPVGKALFSRASVVESDMKAYSQLPYTVERVAGNRWTLVGDAAGFMDPLYSPGLDFCSYTAFTAASLAAEALDGNDVRARVNAYNAQYRKCFDSWFRAIYKDKYYYIGDGQLMSAAMMMDVGTYFLGPVRAAYDDPQKAFLDLPFQGAAGRVFAKFMAFYNRRLAVIARQRKSRNAYGTRNERWRRMLPGFAPEKGAASLLFKGVQLWLREEMRELHAHRKWLRENNTARDKDRHSAPQAVPRCAA